MPRINVVINLESAEELIHLGKALSDTFTLQDSLRVEKLLREKRVTLAEINRDISRLRVLRGKLREEVGEVSDVDVEEKMTEDAADEEVSYESGPEEPAPSPDGDEEERVEDVQELISASASANIEEEPSGEEPTNESDEARREE